MALNQNAHRRNMKSMQTIEELRRNQKKYNKYPTYSTINEMSDYAHDIGDGLSNVNNEKISNIGKTIANNSGDDLKKNLFGFAKDKISSLVNKDKLPNASTGNAVSNVVNNADDTLNVINNSSNIKDAANGLSSLANTTNNIANVADTAGDVAKVADTAGKVADTASKASQASNAISKVGNSNPVLSTATGALQVGGDLAKGNYLDAGLNAAATAANFIPVYGQAVAAAIKIGQKVKQMFDKKKQESMQRSQQAAEQTTQSSLEELNDTKNEIAQKQAQQQQAIDNGFESKTPMTKPSMDNIANEVKPVQPVVKPIEAPIPPVTPVETQPQEESKADIVKGIFDKVQLASDIKNAKAPSSEPVGNFVEKGNIDLFNRPVTQNADGTISTVRSMSFNDGNHEVLIPTVADDGAILSEEDAIDNYYKTGKHLGKFNSVEDANKYADSLHNQQDELYSGSNGGEALPKETTTKGLMDKVKGLFSKEEGQMTGGAADSSKILDMFEDPTVFSDYNKLAREQEQKQGTAPFKNLKYGLQGKLRGDTTSDMNGSVAYDYRSPATQENENRRIADMINKEIEARRQLAQQAQQPAVQEQTAQQPIKIGQDVQFTPEQQARYNKAMAIQNAGSQSEALPPVPTATPTSSPSRTNFDTNQFEIIEPDGTMHPAQQAQQPVIQGQVSTTQPAQAAQPQQQVIPYDEKQGKVADVMRRIRQGWDENTTEKFNPTNITDKTYNALVQDKDGNISKQEIAKNIWNRVGEGVGTGQKLLSNPLMQGLIAGALYKATGGDTGESLAYGADWAQKKAKSDFYQKQMDPNFKPNIIGGYTAEDWKTKESIENAKAQQQYSQALLEERRRENNIRIQKMISDMQKGSNSTQDPSFNETLNGILSNKYIAPERKLEALSNLLRDYSTRGKSQLAYAKSFADLYGIDLDLGI